VLERCVDNNVHVHVRTRNEIGKLFPFKDNIKEKHAQSLVVYRLTCETCKQRYIGNLNPKKDSTTQTHLQENPTHVLDPENIKILDKATSNFKIRLKEELHIITHKSELNSQHAAAHKRKHNKDIFKSNIKTLIISQSS
jgi:hypothetical protein